MSKTITVVALVHVRCEKVLLVRPASKTVFYFPGGMPEPGESELETLHREIREELGTCLSQEHVVPLGTFEAQAHGEPDDTRVRLRCYLGELEGIPKPSSEIAEIGYFSPSDYSHMTDTAPAVHAVLSDLLAHSRC